MTTHIKKALKKWETIVADFVRSGLTPSKYCKKTGVNPNTLYAWRSRIGKVSESVPSDSVFKELKLSEASSSEKMSSISPINITFGNKVKISLCR